jgi:hypothetical protein
MSDRSVAPADLLFDLLYHPVTLSIAVLYGTDKTGVLRAGHTEQRIYTCYPESTRKETRYV